MSRPAQFSGTVSFCGFELDLETAELRRNGSKAILPGKPFQVLVTLLGQPGQLVTREELKRQLWPSDTFVDFDVSLNKAVNRLRDALGDSAEHPQFIETLPRKGYRFIGAIESGSLKLGSPAREGEGALVERLVPVGSGSDGQTPSQKVTANETPSPIFPSPVRRYVPVVIALLVIAIVLVTMTKQFSRFRRPELANVQITKLTDSGRAGTVAISTDGRYIAYSLNDGEKESLRLRQIATRSDVEILASGPGFHGLTFSPDSNYVYFVRSDPNDPFFKYLYSMPMLGGQVRKLISDVDSPVSFSPDGRQFAFERGVAKRNVVELRVANADGSGDHVLATIQDGDIGLFQPGPNWSNDGRTIVVPLRILDKQRRWVLASVSVQGGKVRQIYSGLEAFGRPVWMSEHSILIPHYDSEYERSQLWMVSYPEGIARRFTNDLADYDQSLDISRDANTVAAIASTVTSNIWVAPTETLLAGRQITSGELPMIDITETSDGKLLSTGGDGRLWIMNSDGSHREPFSDTRGVGWLTSCGHFVLFASFAADAVTITRADADGSHAIKLISGDVRHPACTPDGRFVFYVNGHRPQKVWRVSSDGGAPVEIADGAGDGVTGPMDISPDGRLFSYPFDEYPPVWKIAVSSASGGQLIKTFDVPGGTTRVRWSTTGTGLQYLVTQNGTTNIWEQSLAGGNPKQLTKFTSGRIFDFNWSSDHRRLLLTRGDVTSDVVLLSNLH
jgi:DNA-binding winged helix-turn-helix (wHTH) protein/Tol biopolymer transport system component